MKTFFALVLLVTVLVTGCVVSQGPRLAGSETPDGAPDILIAFGDRRCAPCMRNKPTLEAWNASGRYEVIFLEGWMGKITVPYYIVVRNGQQIFQTSSINDL